MMEDVPALVESVVKQLEGELRGKIVRPGSKGYDKVIHSVSTGKTQFQIHSKILFIIDV